MDGIVFSFPWETDLMIYIQSLATGFQTMVMSSVTLLGEELLMIAIMAYLYLCVDKKLGSRMAMGIYPMAFKYTDKLFKMSDASV